MRVHDDEQVPEVAEAQGDETPFPDGVGVLTGQGAIVFQDRDRLCEADTVRT